MVCDNGEVPSDENDETLGSKKTPKTTKSTKTFNNHVQNINLVPIPSSKPNSLSRLMKLKEAITHGNIKNNLNNTKFSLFQAGI